MQRHFCNLSAKEYGLIDHPKSFSAAKEINATILDVIDLQYMSYESKWLAIYQTLQKHKNLNALNQQAFDAIENVFEENGIQTMKHGKQKPQQHRIMVRESEQNETINGGFFLAAIAGVVALVCSAIIGLNMMQSAMVASLVSMVVYCLSVVVSK